jgi:hypothetical protein
MVFAPRARRSVLLEMMRALDATLPSGSVEIAPLVSSARAARLVVITDMLGDASEIIAAAKLRVASKGEVILVHIVATEEVNPPAQVLLAVDPEDVTMRRLLDGAMRTEYRERFSAWMEEMAASTRAAGIRYVRALTDEPAAHLVRRVAGEAQRRVV